MKLNSTEKIAIEVLERLGYTVVRPTWPDLIIYKEEKGEKSFKFIEVKSVGDRLSYNQKQTFNLLRALKIEGEVLILNKQTGTYKLVNPSEETVNPYGKRESDCAPNSHRKRDPISNLRRQTMRSFLNSLNKKKKEKVSNINPYIPERDPLRLGEEIADILTSVLEKEEGST